MVKRVPKANEVEGARMRVGTVVHRKLGEWMVVRDKEDAEGTGSHSIPESVGEVVIDLLTVY